MKQVTKEEFEILTRFHPGEVRFYVDTGTDVARRSGTKVKVSHPAAKSRRPLQTARHRTKAVDGDKPPVNRPGFAANRNQFVQLGIKGANGMRPETITYNVYASCTRIFASDPTKVIKRTELTKKLEAALPQMGKTSQIVPAISALIKKGNLRYTGAPNA